MSDQHAGAVDRLAGETLLHDSAWREDWPAWLAAAGVGGVAATAGPVFSLYSLALDEAIHGAGVLIGHMPLVAGPLASGALVAPFPLYLPSRNPLCAVLRATAAAPPLERLLEHLGA